MAEPDRKTGTAGVATLMPTKGGLAEAETPDITLVVPLHNERASLALLVDE